MLRLCFIGESKSWYVNQAFPIGAGMEERLFLLTKRYSLANETFMAIHELAMIPRKSGASPIDMQDKMARTGPEGNIPESLWPERPSEYFQSRWGQKFVR